MILERHNQDEEEKKEKEEQKEDDNNITKENDGNKSCTYKLKKIYQFLKMKVILLPIIFIFLFTITPSTYDGMMYFYINELKFDYEFIGRIQLVSSLAMITGIVIYYNWLSDNPFKKLIIGCTIVATIFNLLQLILIMRWNHFIGIPDTYLSLSLDLATNTLAELQLLPVLVLACKLCPKHLEATIYEVILGIKNFAFVISYRTGGLIMMWLNITKDNFKNLWILVTISSLFPLITLTILLFVPIKTDYKEEFEKLENKMKIIEENSVLNTD